MEVSPREGLIDRLLAKWTRMLKKNVLRVRGLIVFCAKLSDIEKIIFRKLGMKKVADHVSCINEPGLQSDL